MFSTKMLLSHLGFNKSTSVMKKASYEVAFKSKRQIAERTYEFVFEKPKGFYFMSGQHVRMTLLNPSKTDSKGDSRFMTLANIPSEKDLVIAMRMTDSAFKRVLEKMEIGEKVLMQILLGVPHGAFAMDENSSRPTVFLVGGIGIVPAYSMIKDAAEKKLSQKIYLFYSNIKPVDAPYLDDFKSLEEQNPNFKLIATMTEPEKSKLPWKGETGHIDQAMLKRYIDDLNSPIYYIAGLTDMVNAMKTLLKNLGISGDSIRSEDFSNFKMGLMNMTNNSESNKNHLVFGVIGLIVIVAVVAHAGVAVSLFNTFSIKNLSYLTVGSILFIIIFKVFVIKHLLRK